MNNREFDNIEKSTLLSAKANIMETGTIEAKFAWPLKRNDNYRAHGVIRNVPLVELNPLMTGLTFTRFQSGTLNRLYFDFSYDDRSSYGEVYLDYEDMKLQSLTRDKKSLINPVKTIIVNTAVKNDQNIKGEINQTRDQRRSVFQFWAKSMADGIRNAMIPKAVQKDQK